MPKKNRAKCLYLSQTSFWADYGHHGWPQCQVLINKSLTCWNLCSNKEKVGISSNLGNKLFTTTYMLAIRSETLKTGTSRKRALHHIVCRYSGTSTGTSSLCTVTFPVQPEVAQKRLTSYGSKTAIYITKFGIGNLQTQLISLYGPHCACTDGCKNRWGKYVSKNALQKNFGPPLQQLMSEVKTTMEYNSPESDLSSFVTHEGAQILVATIPWDINAYSLACGPEARCVAVKNFNEIS